ncbi:MAG: hypothetical protein IJ689_04330 [Alphaproteobacteria bacterium]|nr:hypothetical protein [Alphaproteobacteria bacterium]
MDGNFFITLCAAFAGFLAPVFFYAGMVRNTPRFGQSENKSAFLPLIAVWIIISTVLYECLYDEKQFLGTLSFLELGVPLVVAAMLCVVRRRFLYPSLLIGAVIGTFIIPDAMLEEVVSLPVLYTKALIIAAWFLFSSIYRYADTGDGMLSLQSLTIAAGVAVLGIINAVPMFLGDLAIVYAAGLVAVLIFTFPPARIKFSTNDACSLGFVMFFLILRCFLEYAGECAAIFALYLPVDVAWALFLKVTFWNKYSDVRQNTAYYSVLDKGISPLMAFYFACRVQIVLFFVGNIQAVIEHTISLIGIAFLMTVWFIYKFRTLFARTQSLRNINRQVIEDLQERVNDIKEYIRKDENF